MELSCKKEEQLKLSIRIVAGESLDSPEKGNVDKMSEKCPKKCPEICPKKCPEIVQTHRKHKSQTIFGHYFPICSVLLFGYPVQCSPVSELGEKHKHQLFRKPLGMQSECSFQKCLCFEVPVFYKERG